MNPITGIVKFNINRRLYNFDAVAEYNMLKEELEEYASAVEQNDKHEMVDGLCDLVVIAVGAIFKLGYDPRLALTETVKEISSRKGSLNSVTGKWEKDKNQNPDTLYKADYSIAER